MSNLGEQCPRRALFVDLVLREPPVGQTAVAPLMRGRRRLVALANRRWPRARLGDVQPVDVNLNSDDDGKMYIYIYIYRC